MYNLSLIIFRDNIGEIFWKNNLLINYSDNLIKKL